MGGCHLTCITLPLEVTFILCGLPGDVRAASKIMESKLTSVKSNEIAHLENHTFQFETEIKNKIELKIKINN